METKGTIFNIQRCSVHDGPGIRTTVFLKGCNNRCAWCHNPESFNSKFELRFFAERCIACGKCFEVCRNHVFSNSSNGERIINRSKCNACGRCVDVCYAGALEFVGKEISVDNVIVELLRDYEYYQQSGGGVTFSGGEAVLQNAFLLEALKACKAHEIHTALETAGNYQFNLLANLIPYLDLLIFDFKIFDPILHKRFIGSDNKVIKENLQLLNDYNIPIIIRTPVIPNINDSPEEITNIVSFLSELKLNLLYYELIPYHKLGESKHVSLGIKDALLSDVPKVDAMIALAKIAAKYLSPVLYGDKKYL